MQMTYHSSCLVKQLTNYGISVFVDTGRVRVKLPWPVEQTPEAVKPLLRQVRERQAEILTYLQHSQKNYKDYDDYGDYEVAGNVVKLYPMRPTCRDVGHCLALTRETDCELYPARLGWCRERT